MNVHPLRWSRVARGLVAAAGLASGAACDSGAREAATASASDVTPLPSWSFDSTMIFPADRSLARAEDGIALPDGRLIVADQSHGLRVVEADGSSKPFGDLPGAGYAHRPPEHAGGANGVSLEPGGTHLLVADVFTGAIYRVELTSGATERVYQHRFGVNAAVRDASGAIWFTQSTQNSPATGEQRMWASVDIPNPDGALLRLASSDGRLSAQADVVIDSLVMANGLAIDERQGYLYIAETMGARVLRYRLDVATGRLSDRTVFAEIAADNLKLDSEGRLWVGSPVTNEVIVVNTATGERQSAFRVQTPAQEELAAEFNRRGRAGESRMDLVTPDYFAPMPGLVTGAIVASAGGPVYVTTLGGALIRLEAGAAR